MSDTQANRERTNSTARLSGMLDLLTKAQGQVAFCDIVAAVFGPKFTDGNRKTLIAYARLTRMLESSQKEIEVYLAPELSFYGSIVPRVCQLFHPKTSTQQWDSLRNQLLQNTDLVGIRHTGQRLKSLVPEF